MLVRTALILLVAFTVRDVLAQVRWVDESGKVHFGDRAPPEYQNSAESIEIRPAPLSGNTQEERDKMRKDQVQLKRIANKRIARERKLNKKRPTIGQRIRPDFKGGTTRAQCRDSYPRETGRRVACFRSAVD